MRQLTPEQQKLVEDNHKLIYGFANNNGIDLEEYYGVLAIALCTAAISYGESKGRFSTLAYRSMRNAYLRDIRDAKRLKKIPAEKICSIQSVAVYSPGGDSELYEMIIPDTGAAPEETALAKETYERLLSRLSDMEKIVFQSLLRGDSQVEIAERHHLSPSRIGQITKRIREKARENMEADYD